MNGTFTPGTGISLSQPTGTEKSVCEDIAKRQALGIAKYGVTVAQNPLELRAWLQHQYEELLDAAVYAKRAIEEIDIPKLAPPVGTVEQRTFRKFPLCSTFEYLGVKLVVVEQRRARPGLDSTYMGFGIIFPGVNPVESALVCNYNQDGKLMTRTFAEYHYPYLLASCKPQ